MSARAVHALPLLADHVALVLDDLPAHGVQTLPQSLCQLGLSMAADGPHFALTPVSASLLLACMPCCWLQANLVVSLTRVSSSAHYY